MNLLPPDHGPPFPDRRARSLRAIGLEIRLDSADELLAATADEMVLALACIHVEEMPARRASDRAWRVVLAGIGEEGTKVDLGAICGHVAERLLHVQELLVAHVDRADTVRLIRLPIGGAGTAHLVAAAQVPALLKTLFSNGTVDVAHSAQPANPDPALPLLRRLRNVTLSARDTARAMVEQGSSTDA
jgi:hypothetical protein